MTVTLSLEDSELEDLSTSSGIEHPELDQSEEMYRWDGVKKDFVESLNGLQLLKSCDSPCQHPASSVPHHILCWPRSSRQPFALFGFIVADAQGRS